MSNIKDFCQTFQQLKKEEKKNKADIVRLSVANSAFHPSDFFCRYFFSIFLKMFRKIKIYILEKKKSKMEFNEQKFTFFLAFMC